MKPSNQNVFRVLDIPAAPHTPSSSLAPRYLAPGKLDRLANRAVRRLVRWGVSVWGARELTVAGRRSGQLRHVIVNLLEVDGSRYLVAPRGDTEWVRNLRAAGGAQLRLGRRAEQFIAIELPDVEKEPVVRAYLERWSFEVGRFFEGLTASSSPAEVLAVAGGFPVFRIALPDPGSRA